MRVAIIVNPISGPRRGARGGPDAAELAQACLAARRVEGEVFRTARVGHARDLAADAVARGIDLVVAWGGDGTVNEVGSAVAFSRSALGVVPAGSGNGFGRALGLPRRPDAALAAVLDGRTRRIDVGEIGGRLFLNVAGLGLDAAIAHRFSEGPRRRGFAVYVWLSLRELWSHQPARYLLEHEAFSRETAALIVAVANSPQYGNGALIAPGARLDDGELDLVVVTPVSGLGNLLRARRLFTGTIDRDRHTWRRRIRALRIESEVPLRYHVDGEPCVSDGPLDVRIHPGALAVRVPTR
jgi:diacylglycerol kinase (ATP)